MKHLISLMKKVESPRLRMRIKKMLIRKLKEEVVLLSNDCDVNVNLLMTDADNRPDVVQQTYTDTNLRLENFMNVTRTSADN